MIKAVSSLGVFMLISGCVTTDMDRANARGSGDAREAVYPETMHARLMFASKGKELAKAQYLLGQLYASGKDGAPQDLAEAARWYREAAEKQYGDAQFALGMLYSRGEGVPHDPVAAAKWFRRAAQRVHVDALFHLAACYLQGEGVETSTVQAAQWIHMAAQRGHCPSQLMLGAFFAVGEGVDKDLAQAFMWYTLASSDAALAGLAAGEIAKFATEMTASTLARAEQFIQQWEPWQGYPPLHEAFDFSQCEIHTASGENEKVIYLPGNLPLVMVRIPAGTFQMGSPETERGRRASEGPVRTVTIAYDFYMGKYPVTQLQWMSLMGVAHEMSRELSQSIARGYGENYPMFGIAWAQAKEFIVALNKHILSTSQGPYVMRLPSEAEWEYACRAGTQTRFYFGDSLECADTDEDDGVRGQHMWYAGNHGNRIIATLGRGVKPVGLKLPNAFGLYDMLGNVWEWCEDEFSRTYSRSPSDGSPYLGFLPNDTSSYRVLRGGCSTSSAAQIRSAARNCSQRTAEKTSLHGFRLVCQP